MMTAPTDELLALHQAVVATIRTIPEEALDWQPEADAWSLKRICAHVANSYDFYVMVVEQVRAGGFGRVRLHRALPGWQAMVATDAAVLACATVPAVRVQVERAYARVVSAMEGLQVADYERPFVLYDSWAPGAAPETTTLRRRVLDRATAHLQEHHAQMQDTLARWRAVPPRGGEAAVCPSGGERTAVARDGSEPIL